MPHVEHKKKGPFIKRHVRLFTFIGALIVFLTFVVKEGKREQIKSVADSLANAEANFSIGTDHSATHSELRQLTERVKDIQEALGQKQLHAMQYVEQGMYSQYGVQDVLDRTRLSIENMDNLVRMMSDGVEAKTEVIKARERWNQLNEKNKQTIKNVVLAARASIPLLLKHAKSMDDAFNEFHNDAAE